jgi:hypothetical protein
MTILALATLGDVTKNRNDPISVVPRKMSKASTIMCRCCKCYRAKLRQWKHRFTRPKSFVAQAPAFIRKRLRQRLKLKKGVADEIKSEIKKVGRLKKVE